jgi:8-oxo-dGTP pyrophosphatase MutT (NUDIX family)
MHRGKDSVTQPQPDIVTLSTRLAYENRWTRLREDKIRRRDGADGIYGVVERPDFVIVAACQDGCLTLVEQYRYPIRRRMWELPMGAWEDTPDADPVALAAGELREETGLVAGSLVKVGTLFQGPGFCTQKGHVFLATDLQQSDYARDATEQDMICRAFPLAEVEAMVRNGMLQDGMTVAALGLLRLQGLL